MINPPLTVHYADGESDLIFPSRAIAAVALAESETAVWHFNAAGVPEQHTAYANVKHVRAALGLPDE